MSVTQIDIDDDALERAMALSGVKTKKEAVNLALRFYAEKQERAARIAGHFERARHWGALEAAERLHRAEKKSGDLPARHLGPCPPAQRPRRAAGMVRRRGRRGHRLLLPAAD